jgi:hypothetical protein
MPTYSIFGWQKPCYLLQDGYADTFQELMDAVEWHNYGTESGNPRCANCMVHSGYEASGVNYTFGSFKGLMQTAKAIFSSKYEDEGAMKILNEWKPEGHGPLVQIADKPTAVVVTTSVDSNMTSVAGV